MRVHRHTARLVRPASLAVALLASALLLSGGCAIGLGGGPAQPAAAGRSGRPAPAPAKASGQGAVSDLEGSTSVAEFRKDAKDAAVLAGRYWEDQLTASRIEFTPVRRVVAYESEGEVVCGGQALGLRNAAYCSAGDFIAYDVNWAVEAFRQVGDAFMFYLLGHEYAHGVQVRLGLRARFTIQQELQADCMAGAYIGDLVRSGKLRVSEADLAEFRTGLLAVGDDPAQPWFAEGAHGTAEQRTEAFFNGYERSLEPCDLD